MVSRTNPASPLLLLNVCITVAGRILALFLTGQTLSVSSLVGFIAPFGIALQNGIVLVGTINDLRRKGAALHQAVVRGAINRFRPILMTELILILGVLPLALGTSSGSEIHRPLALVYIGGSLVAIFFVQIVFPILYEWASIMARFKINLDQRAGRIDTRQFAARQFHPLAPLSARPAILCACTARCSRLDSSHFSTDQLTSNHDYELHGNETP